jgi:hypothetical protein
MKEERKKKGVYEGRKEGKEGLYEGLYEGRKVCMMKSTCFMYVL